MYENDLFAVIARGHAHKEGREHLVAEIVDLIVREQADTGSTQKSKGMVGFCDTNLHQSCYRNVCILLPKQPRCTAVASQ